MPVQVLKRRTYAALLEIGLLEKTESGKIVCPFDKVRVDFTLE
jgi:hypothetical protein